MSCGSTWWARGGVLLVGVALAGASAGCNESEAAAPPPVPDAAPSEPRVEKETFVASISAEGAFEKGKEGSVTVTLEPRGVYKINGDYPAKFKVESAPGVSFKRDLVTKEDGEFSEKKGTLPIAFTADEAGEVQIKGRLSLSVCSEENCILEKVDLATTVAVK